MPLLFRIERDVNIVNPVAEGELITCQTTVITL